MTKSTWKTESERRHHGNPMRIENIIHTNSYDVQRRMKANRASAASNAKIQKMLGSPTSSSSSSMRGGAGNGMIVGENGGLRKLTKAEKKRIWRAKMSPERRRKIQEEDARRKRIKRQNLSEEEKDVIRKRDAARKAESRRREKQMQRERAAAGGGYGSGAQVGASAQAVAVGHGEAYRPRAAQFRY